MISIKKEDLENLREEYKKGDKVKLVHMDDLQAPSVGTIGTVSHVDDAGSIAVNWSNGSSLRVLYKVDIIKKLN